MANKNYKVQIYNFRYSTSSAPVEIIASTPYKAGVAGVAEILDVLPSQVSIRTNQECIGYGSHVAEVQGDPIRYDVGITEL